MIPDVIETNEWLDALEAVIDTEGPDRAHYLMERMMDLARRRGANILFSTTTAYVNTIPADKGAHCPCNLEIEERLRSYMRWNAMAMVVKANRLDGDLVVTCLVSHLWQICWELVSTISGMHQRQTMVVICCTSKVTHLRYLCSRFPRRSLERRSALALPS